jgi:serine/threonine protein phosphatase 1
VIFSEPNYYRRIYVIGDIHGRLDLLDRIVQEIEHDLAIVPTEPCLTITLGDYVDRGPDSRGVLDRLSRNPFPTAYVALKGNHEELFEGVLLQASFEAVQHWLKLGGLQTLQSYGVPVKPALGLVDFSRALEALRAAVSPDQIKFLKSLRLSLELDRHFFCHAGIRPGVSFEDQRQEDLLWIRDDFLGSKLNFGKMVVHGHTPVLQPEVLPNRINIDTAAFATGRLTCLVLEGDSHRFLIP